MSPCSRSCASSERATTSSPDVSRSSRWTIPGRSSAPPAVRPASPWTSVPVAWPAPGCTTTPAGLSTTNRWSSSYAMPRSTCSGSISREASGGSSTSRSSPPSSRWLFGRARPSTRTLPPSTSRSAAERDPISGTSARKRSSRAPAASCGTLSLSVGNRTRPLLRALRDEQRGEQDEHAEDDEAVGEVERGPEAQVDEVRHVPEPDAVEEVGRAAAYEQAERDGEDRVPRSGARKEDEHPGHCDRGQDRHDRRGAGEEAERDPGVLHVVDRQRPGDVPLGVEREVARDDVLRQLVARERCQSDRQEADPLLRPRVERATRPCNGRQRVGRRADTDVEVTGRRLAQPRSSSRLQSMHCVAHGIAASRSSEIGFPPLTHVPYVPSSMRARAPSIAERTFSEFSSSV